MVQYILINKEAGLSHAIYRELVHEISKLRASGDSFVKERVIVG
jgi:hypothetical protein